MESAGVANVLTKIIGSRNPFNVVRATFNAIDRLMTLGEVQRLRGVEVAAEADAEPEPESAPAEEPTKTVAVEEVENS
jgi:hypothetical protein